MDFLGIPGRLEENLHIVWTFLLLITRYGGLLLTLPGIGMGERGLLIRLPAIIVLAFASLSSGNYAAVPADWALLLAQVTSEFILGMAIGLIPLLIISGVQTAAQIAGTTMGLGGGGLIDPTTGTQNTDLGRIYGDLCILLFLFLGGHYVAIHAASGLGGQIVPGSFLINESSVALMIDRTGDIFRVGVMVSAPVVVALLLTQFVMGLISKAVPTVNIFMVSFPLTIGIGLVISILALPELFNFVTREYAGLERTIGALVMP